MNSEKWTILWIAAWIALAYPATVRADRILDKAEYADKLRGMWFGELIGNHAGRPVEGVYTFGPPPGDEVFAWDLHTNCANPWTGDDDTNVEYMYLHALETHGAYPTFAQLQSEWQQHTGLGGFFIANKQSIFLMGHGFAAPNTGSWRNNAHAYAIDCQITTESIGAYSPGLRQWAIDTTGRCARITNDGYPVHAAQFYAAMYASAAFESDVSTIVAMAHECIPTTSRSWQVVNNVRTWYAADMADGTPDWRATRALLYNEYRLPGHGRYRGWIESTINLGCTTMALLYGDGDFEETVRIAVLAGFDADCNPATAGGLIGLIKGFSGLPTTLTATATDCYRIEFLNGLPTDESVLAIANRMNLVAESVIVAEGGSSDAATLVVPDEAAIVVEPERPYPAGPSGLTALVLSRGGSVAVDSTNYRNFPGDDRLHAYGIIDGIKEVEYNGHVAYETWNSLDPQPGGQDFYSLNSSETLRFDSLIFYEGDIRPNNANTDPRLDEPLGGYFLNLTVDVRGANGWREANNIQLSEPLDPFAYYQVIEIDFDAIAGDAVRIRGSAGGRHGYTSILELECHGGLVGDFDGNDLRDADDINPFVLALLGIGQNQSVVATADMNADDIANGNDIALFVDALLNP